MSGAGFNEGKTKPFSAADNRFTTKGEAVYAFVMGWPETGKVVIESMRSGGPHLAKRVARVELLGSGRKLAFRQTAEGLHVTLPTQRPALDYAIYLQAVPCIEKKRYIRYTLQCLMKFS